MYQVKNSVNSVFRDKQKEKSDVQLTVHKLTKKTKFQIVIFNRIFQASVYARPKTFLYPFRQKDDTQLELNKAFQGICNFCPNKTVSWLFSLSHSHRKKRSFISSFASLHILESCFLRY